MTKIHQLRAAAVALLCTAAVAGGVQSAAAQTESTHHWRGTTAWHNGTHWRGTAWNHSGWHRGYWRGGYWHPGWRGRVAVGFYGGYPYYGDAYYGYPYGAYDYPDNGYYGDTYGDYRYGYSYGSGPDYDTDSCYDVCSY